MLENNNTVNLGKDYDLAMECVEYFNNRGMYDNIMIIEGCLIDSYVVDNSNMELLEIDKKLNYKYLFFTETYSNAWSSTLSIIGSNDSSVFDGWYEIWENQYFE